MVLIHYEYWFWLPYFMIYYDHIERSETSTQSTFHTPYLHANCHFKTVNWGGEGEFHISRAQIANPLNKPFTEYVKKTANNYKTAHKLLDCRISQTIIFIWTSADFVHSFSLSLFFFLETSRVTYHYEIATHIITLLTI